MRIAPIVSLSTLACKKSLSLFVKVSVMIHDFFEALPYTALHSEHEGITILKVTHSWVHAPIGRTSMRKDLEGPPRHLRASAALLPPCLMLVDFHCYTWGNYLSRMPTGMNNLIICHICLS